jgi:glycolate oxidase
MEGAVERCLVALSRALPDDRILTDRDVCEAHARDESEAEGSMPSAVIRARGAQDVVAVLTAAGAHGVPVTPRGAGTGRTGGAVPMRGGLVLACDRMRGDIDIDVRNGTAVVGPGVVTLDVHDAVEAEGLFWGPDPNSWAECTVGGNIAENAGGPRTFKYGATRDWVLGLEIVTGEGTRMDVGRRTRIRTSRWGGGYVRASGHESYSRSIFSARLPAQCH